MWFFCTIVFAPSFPVRFPLGVELRPCGNTTCDYGAVCDGPGLGCSCHGLTCPPGTEGDAPVCGNDGRTYASECQMRMEACQRQQYIIVANYGPCGKVDNELGHKQKLLLFSHISFIFFCSFLLFLYVTCFSCLLYVIPL